MKTATLAILGGLLLASASAGAPASGPASRPSDELRIKQLIGQLADPAFAKREAAAEELRKMGAAAIGQLDDAKKHPDPEIAARAEAVLDEIKEQVKLKAATSGPIAIADLVGRWTGSTQFQEMKVVLVIGEDGSVTGGDMGGHPLQKKGKASVAGDKEPKVIVEFYFSDVCQNSKKTIEKVTFTRGEKGGHQIAGHFSNPCFPPSSGWIKLTRTAPAAAR